MCYIVIILSKEVAAMRFYLCFEWRLIPVWKELYHRIISCGIIFPQNYILWKELYHNTFDSFNLCIRMIYKILTWYPKPYDILINSYIYNNRSQFFIINLILSVCLWFPVVEINFVNSFPLVIRYKMCNIYMYFIKSLKILWC